MDRAKTIMTSQHYVDIPRPELNGASSTDTMVRSRCFRMQPTPTKTVGGSAKMSRPHERSPVSRVATLTGSAKGLPNALAVISKATWEITFSV